MIIKICGITSEEQAEQISSFGATHLGVIYFSKSPRHVEIEKIKSIKKHIGKNTLLTAVVVNPEEKTVNKLLDIVDVIQFHGDESLDFVLKFPEEKVIKAFRVKEEKDIDKIVPFVEAGILPLIDAYHQSAYGGTGKRINPELAKKIVGRFGKVILSGGLSNKNIEEILVDISPYGVDASSKLEIKPGIKDIEKVKDFVKKAKSFYEKNSGAVS